MKCEEADLSMSRWLDNDLNDSEVLELNKHLDVCMRCADAYERLKRLSDELAQLPKVLPAYSLVDAILPKLNEIDGYSQLTQPDGQTPKVEVAAPFGSSKEGKEHKHPFSRTRRFFETVTWLKTAGVTAAGLLIGLLIWKADFGGNLKTANSASGMMDKSTVIAAPQSDQTMKADQHANTFAAAGVQSQDNSGNSTDGADIKASPAAKVLPSVKATASSRMNKGIASSDSSSSPSEQQQNPTAEVATPAATSAPIPESEPKNKAAASPAGEQTLMAAEEQPLSSLDGHYSAQLKEGKLIIIDTKTEEVVYTSSDTFKAEEHITLHAWTDDSKLIYSIDAGEGNASKWYVIDPFQKK